MHAVDLQRISLVSPSAHLAGWADLHARLWAEQVPTVGRPTDAEALYDLDSDSERRGGGLLAVDGDTPIGALGWGLPLLENREFAFGWLYVDPAHRRRGVGRSLYAEAAVELRAQGRRRLGLDTVVGSPGERFAAALGASFEQVDLSNVLDVTDIDDEDLAAPVDREEPSAYRLVQWRDRCPGELVDAFAVARGAMNDAPRGESMPDDMHCDAARVRLLEDRHARWGFGCLTTAAVHEPSRAVAGFTEILVTGRPCTALQEDTGVVRAHRGHGLGLAMKRANLRRLRAEHPEITHVCTWNAEDNRWMRAVNDRLGFRVNQRLYDVAFAL